MLDVDGLEFAVEEFCICFDLVQCSASPERLDGNNLFLVQALWQASKVDCSECISWSGLGRGLEVK